VNSQLIPPGVGRHLRAKRHGNEQAGMSLIEVLVSIVLVSIGMVGLLGLLASSMQSSNGAQDRNRAALLANEMVSAMWLNSSTNVNAAPLSNDYAAWQAAVTAALYGNGAGTVNVPPGSNVATISITWTAPNLSASKSANNVNTYGAEVAGSVYSTQVVAP
jgi:type IV pilus assembly protein PilV